MKNDKRAALIWIPLGILLVVSMGYFFYDLLLSCVNYVILKGVFGSRFVGLKNFEMVFSSAAFASQLGNSLTHSILLIVCALIFGVPVALLLGLIPSRPVKAAFAGVALAAALLPDVFWVKGVLNMLPVSATSSAASFLPVFILCRLAPLTAMAVFAGLSLNLAENKNGAIGALLVGLLPLLTLFTPEYGTAMLLQNPLNYQFSDTISTGVYRAGLMQAKVSYGEAMALTGTILNLIAGVGFIFALGAMAKRKKGMVKVADAQSPWLVEGILGAAGAAAAGVIMLVAWAVGKNMAADALLGRAALNTFGAALLAAAFIFGVCMLVFAGTRYCRGGIGMMIMMFLLLQMSALHMSHYFTVRSAGLINTIVPVAFGVLLHPVLLTVLMVLMVCRPTSGRQMLFASAGAALIAAAVSAGDWFTGLLYINNTKAYTLAMQARQSALMPSGGSDRFMLVMLAMVIGFAVLGALMTFAGLGGSALEKPQPAETEF